jgi:hypothetical protein
VERLVKPLLAGELGQPQRESRVGDDRRPVVLEACVGKAAVERVVLADADAVPSVELRERDS